MAPLTCFRSVFDTGMQLRLNSWMLMTGSLGMVASTLPVQLVLPYSGWRGLFVALAVLLALAMLGIARFAPPTPVVAAAQPGGGYRVIMQHPAFVALAPLGFFSYGGLIAIQSLWAGPWLTQVAGQSAVQAAQGLLIINLGMLLAFMAWGVVMPRLARSGLHARQLIAWGAPLSLLALAAIIVRGPEAGALHWALWCVLSSCITLSQPFVAQAFPSVWAGRALSAFNLMIFCGVFCLQWGIGVAVDAFASLGWSRSAALRGAMAMFALCCVLAQLWFLLRQRRMVIIESRATHR
jgi:hypothetical protein